MKVFPVPVASSEQNALFFFGNGIHRVVDRDFLIVAHAFGAAYIFKRHLIKFVPPFVLRGKCLVPEFIGVGKAAIKPSFAGFHADLVNLFAVAGIRSYQCAFFRRSSWLAPHLRQLQVHRFWLRYCELATFIHQHIIGDQRFGASAAGLDFAGSDLVFPQDF